MPPTSSGHDNGWHGSTMSRSPDRGDTSNVTGPGGFKRRGVTGMKTRVAAAAAVQRGSRGRVANAP